MAHRYFTTDITGTTAHLSGPDAEHLARVLRAKPGQRVTLCNGAGYDYAAAITDIAPRCVTLKILETAINVTEPVLKAHMFIGMARGERMDWAIQKTVELGATAIWPFYSENTVVKPKNDAEKTERFCRIAAEAAKQAGRGILPVVHPPLGFGEMLQQATQSPLALFCYEEGGRPLTATVAGEGEIAVITGPEGGFTPAEARQAEDAGCAIIGLGPRILRSETAPVAVLAALMVLNGDMETP